MSFRIAGEESLTIAVGGRGTIMVVRGRTVVMVDVIVDVIAPCVRMHMHRCTPG